MKARVKATGEIVCVLQTSNGDYEEFETHNLYCPDELVFDVADKDAIYNKGSDPDYWTRLEHQAAIAAMQGLCANSGWDNVAWKDMAEDAISAAHALVEKMKEAKQ